jgi:hypothetical protein
MAGFQLLDPRVQQQLGNGVIPPMNAEAAVKPGAGAKP